MASDENGADSCDTGAVGRDNGADIGGNSAAGCLDLHMHSTFSDGSKTVSELIGDARQAELAGIAICDHDALSQLSFVRATAREMGFPVLAGVEVSAFDPASGHKVHLLGYSLEATPDGSGPLERLVARTLADRTANTLWQAWKLCKLGESFRGTAPDLDLVAQVAGDSLGVYKQHLLEAVSGLPHSDPAYAELSKSWFRGPHALVGRSISYPSALEALRCIREQGGVAVLAHPGQMDNWSIVPDLVAAGLQGIEAHHPDHTSEHVERARELSRRYGLFVTGGSDYHGKYGASACVGVRCVSVEEAGPAVQRLFEREASLR